MIYPYNVILFGHIKEWSTDSHYNMDEFWAHYANWKKPNTKVMILFVRDDQTAIGENHRDRK